VAGVVANGPDRWAVGRCFFNQDCGNPLTRTVAVFRGPSPSTHAAGHAKGLATLSKRWEIKPRLTLLGIRGTTNDDRETGTPLPRAPEL